MHAIQYFTLNLLILLITSFHSIASEKSNSVTNTVQFNQKQSVFTTGSIIAGGVIGLGLALELSKDRDHWWSSKYAFQNSTYKEIHDYTTVVDDYTQFAPLGIAVGMIALNKKGQNKRGEQVALLITSEIVGLGAMGLLKNNAKRKRPDGSKVNSFPSGHTTQAFIAARYLDKEFGDKYPWVKYTGYALASFTGVSRVLNNRHWISDILVGAGLGILSVDLTYWGFKQLQKKKISISPLTVRGGAGLKFKMVL
ncbi:phosphatase PAP2 family protein [Ancylomarina sp. DW003]|nr:phosphatase PAP2 family protein [Ancylomarina sp. DW003]MDE5423688.1 phosphatase PAP2 family protein [Ancylomarina sp. DW003]